MTAEDFIAAGGEVKVVFISPSGESETVAMKPAEHSRGSVGWRHKGEQKWMIAGEEIPVSIALTIVVQKSAKWDRGKKRWSKAVAEMYQKQFGTIPDNVTVMP